MLFIPPGKEIGRWPGEPPIGAQNAEQLRRQHHVAIFRAFAVTDQDHAARAVDVRHSQPRNLRGPEPGRIGRGQRRPALQTRNGFEKSHDLVGAEHDRQLARLSRVRDPLGDGCLAERDAVEETQGADDLVETGPRDARGDQVNLESADVFQAQPLGRLAEISAELRDRADVGSLRRRRHVTDRHVLDHAAAKRAQLGHR